MNFDEAMEYLNESEEEDYRCLVVDVPIENIEDVLGETMDYVTADDITELRERVIEDIKELVENKLDKLITRHSRHLTKCSE